MVKRQRVPVQINQFVGGINTESNPLSFPEGASIDELNMDFNRDGSRTRRNGFDAEANHNVVSTPILTQAGLTLAHSQSRWENPGGYNNAEFLVVQVGNCINIHDLNSSPVSTAPVFTKTFPVETYETVFGYAIVDGTLVVATGENVIYVLNYNGVSITSEERPLLIRDLFGVEASASGVELTSPTNIQIRPSILGNSHLYNLRNQTFALPRVSNADDNTDLRDILTEFKNESAGLYPSNADNVIKFIYPNANRSSDREVERYHGKQMNKTPPSNTKAPIGYFIIDALERGRSRLEEEAKLRAANSALDFSVDALNTDRTPGGASVLAQYSGRVWYAGFSAEVINGDSKSPRLSSYVLFSQVVQDPSDINLCYQAADPTSVDDPALVDTDGGFLKIDGAYNIQALIPVDTSLFVLAENGVWRVVGLDENTFIATSYSISKITEEGCVSPKSAVVSGKSLSYWGDSGIFGIAKNDVGDWAATNLTQASIQQYYDGISSLDKTTSTGYYDSENLTVRWVWGDVSTEKSEANELILSLKHSAFTKNSITLPAQIHGLASVSGGQVPSGSLSVAVTSDGEEVTSGGEVVTISSPNIQRGVTTAFYTVLVSLSPTPSYTLGRYNRLDTTYDWSRFGAPTDSPAYIIGGSITGGEARLKKDVPYLSVHFKEPEDNRPESQCILTAQWDWTTNYELGKWTSPRQIYRPQRAGNQGGVLPTRNKIRGFGRSVAFKLESVEGYGMHIYGWEYNIEATTVE